MNTKQCRHNKRCRYTNGFYCEDCETFFSYKSPTYRKSELLSSISMTLWNLNAEQHRSGKPPLEDVKVIHDKIGIGIIHENYEELIAEAEVVMAKYQVNAESSTMVINE